MPHFPVRRVLARLAATVSNGGVRRVPGKGQGHVRNPRELQARVLPQVHQGVAEEGRGETEGSMPYCARGAGVWEE